MKFIIRESQTETLISKYYDKQIQSEKFKWIDKIDIIKTTTADIGWLEEDIKPVFKYIVYIKPNYSPNRKDKGDIAHLIGFNHNILFTKKDKLGKPEAYYGVSFSPEN